LDDEVVGGLQRRGGGGHARHSCSRQRAFNPFVVIPAKAGIQGLCFEVVLPDRVESLDSRLRGNDEPGTTSAPAVLTLPPWRAGPDTPAPHASPAAGTSACPKRRSGSVRRTGCSAGRHLRP